jgi:hypothetical protein
MTTTKIKSLDLIIPTEGGVPDGDYQGLWSGYEVRVIINEQGYRLHTEDGIRGLNIPCVVRVRDGVISVTAA